MDIYEPKDYTIFGPTGCNHCGGVISETLVQILAAEGINIPPEIIRRGINAYVLHMDAGSVRINTPTDEKRIVAMFRGAGPKGTTGTKWESFDGFLQKLTKKIGAHIIHDWVSKIEFNPEGLPIVKTRKGRKQSYDLVVGAGGLNPSIFKLFKPLSNSFQAPKMTKSSIREFHLGNELIRKYFGDAMHVFLLDIPQLKFAALIPKGDYVTLVLLGEKIDKNLQETFLNSPVVKNCFPPDWDLTQKYSCQCFPSINVQSAVKPFCDRIVLIGDSATTKLYKNGIGAAYVTAKAAAITAIYGGVSSRHFKKYFWPVCKSIKDDNSIGKRIFSLIEIIQKQKHVKKGLLNQVHKENQNNSNYKPMSMILWDTFTGNAPYRDIFWRMLRPFLLFSLAKNTFEGLLRGRNAFKNIIEARGTDTGIGRIYQHGEIIIRQGEEARCMYVIQWGEVEIVSEKNGKEFRLATLGKGDFFGEMSLFERKVRSTSVKAKGLVQVITIDKQTLLRQIQVDPSVTFRILKKMSFRIHNLNQRLTQI